MRTSKAETSTTVGVKTAMHSPRQRFKEALRRAPTHTLSFTVANSRQATADQHDRELVPSPSHYSPLYRPLEAIPCVVCLLNPAAWCANQRMCYVYTERIINARALRLSHDRMQVLKIVPYIMKGTKVLSLGAGR